MHEDESEKVIPASAGKDRSIIRRHTFTSAFLTSTNKVSVATGEFIFNIEPNTQNRKIANIGLCLFNVHILQIRNFLVILYYT